MNQHHPGRKQFRNSWQVLSLGLFLFSSACPLLAAAPMARARSSTWTDPTTGLIWAGHDNGTNLNWYQAGYYCANLDLDGYTSWRLPSIDELSGIYDETKDVNNGWHIKGQLRVTDWEWSSPIDPNFSPSQNGGHEFASAFSFLNGQRWVADTLRSDEMRVLCVHGSGAPSSVTTISPQGSQVDESEVQRQDIEHKIEELQSDIEVHESAAQQWDNTAQNLASSGCSGAGAAICESIGQMGIAKARANANKERNTANEDRAEISRLRGENAAIAPKLDPSFAGNLRGSSNSNAIVDAGNQQAAAIRAVGDANAAQQQAAAQQAAAQQRLAAQQAQQGGGGSSSGRSSPSTETCPSMQVFPDMGSHCNVVQNMNQCVNVVSSTWTGKASTQNFGLLTVVFANTCGQAIRLRATGPDNGRGQLQMVGPAQQFTYTESQHGSKYHYSADDGTDCFVNANRPGCGSH